MDFTQESLQALVSEFLARHDGLTEGDIEDIYPCSPVQEAVLASQHQGRSDYVIRGTLEVMSLGDGPVQLGRLEDAWKSVVRQSPILRTVFLEDTTGRGLFCQVVVRSIAASIDKVQCSSLNSFLDRVGWTKDSFSPHCLTFWEAPAGKTYLKLELNHAISDGVATLVIVHELMRLYDDPSLRLTGPSYRDFMTHLRDVPYEEHLDYWRDFLSGAELSNFTRLSDPTPSGSEPKIGRREMKLDRNRIRAVGGDKGVTLTMFFQAVWAVILRSYLHSNDVLFGFVSSGRRCVPLKAVGTALGPYIAQMVARAQIQNSDTLVELAKKLHHSTTEALSHEQCSLARIQRELRFNGSMFNTMVDVQRHPPLHKTGKAIYMAIADVYSPTEYDIVLNVEDRGTELAAKINYSTDFFTAADAEVLESVFLSTVEQFLRDPEQRVMDLDLAPRHHQDRIMSWNSTLPEPVDECIPNLIDIEAARFPEAPAIRSLDMDMTFQELADATNRLARHLVWLGVSPGDMIPFCMEKSPWAIIAMLAIMKAGAAFVPLDPANPPSRSAGIVADTNASIILTSPTIQPAVTAFSEQAIIVVVDDSILETSQSNSELPSLRPDYVAYVLFTSGSTGKPKGVVVPHRSICSSMRGHGPGMGTVRGARVLQFAAFTFDAMVYEVFTVLATGGCVCVPSDQDRLDDTVSAINQLDVNLLMLTPTFLRTIDPSSVPGVETVILIGEAAGKDVVDAWCDRFSRELGMTHDIIGKAVGCRSWVVDPEDHNKLAPLGAVGELLIEGPGVSKGYLNDAEKTAASFIEPPSWLAGLGLGSPDAHAAFYKTGDVVRQLYDGSLKFCGRVDDQVKVNGQRLELGEVETHLTASGLVLQSLAYVPKSGPVSGRLVALISLRKTTGIAPQPKASKDTLQLPSEGLRDEVAQEIAVLSESIQSSLPAYMVPSIWIPVLSMPMQQSGKLDRKTICSAVLNMDDATFQKISSFQSIGVDQELDQAFAGKLVESRLRDIWSEVLNTPKSNIGLHRPFLALGGDSISAMRVVSRARTEGIRLGVADILRHSTIAEI
ncbi:acetyl-CoA synthetase-like protein, partial [Thozetella sp. PMI_491]